MTEEKNMSKQNGNNNTQLIEAAKERLRWYTMEASEEEYDAEEVEALVILLSTLEPVDSVEMQSEEQMLERFHEYVEMRDAEEGQDSLKQTVEKKKNSKIVAFIKKHKMPAVAATIFLMIIVAGGSMGAVNASKGNGFFYWLNRDEKGMTMITSPENMGEGMVVEEEEKYFRMEDVPKKYQKYVIDVDCIELLEEYKLEYIKGIRTESYCGVKQCLKDGTGEIEIYLGAFVFSDKKRLTYEAYLGTEDEYNLKNVQEDTILIRENPSGDAEYKIYFYKDNIQYYVEGNVNKNILFELAIEYKDIVLNN